MSEFDVQTAVKAVTERATFDFGAAVSDRNYPEYDVPVYLDETKASELISITMELNELTQMASRMSNIPGELGKRVEALEARHDALVDSMKENKYIIKVKGVSPEVLRDIEEEVFEEFPIEYEENKNPVSGVITKTPIENPDRDLKEIMRIRQVHIVSVTAPDGAVDDDFSDLDKLSTVVTRLPFMARTKLDEAINACTITVDYYRELVDEVF